MSNVKSEYNDLFFYYKELKENCEKIVKKNVKKKFFIFNVWKINLFFCYKWGFPFISPTNKIASFVFKHLRVILFGLNIVSIYLCTFYLFILFVCENKFLCFFLMYFAFC